MPTVVIKPGATIFVTGINGLIGSHVADQLLNQGYNVRGAVRDVEKTKWLKEYFDEKYKNKKFELLAVPDMTVGGCYDNILEGIEGFIHLAAPVGTVSDLNVGLYLGRRAGLNALEACAKAPSVKRFVNTSSSTAAAFSNPGLNEELRIDETTYNDAAADMAKVAEPRSNAFLVYAAMKADSEKTMWQWMKDNKPDLVMNSILPNVNLGPVLVPAHQGYPSTIDWARAPWTGENFEAYAALIPPQWFISVRDNALLHISALIHSEVNGERLFGYAGRYNFNDLLAIYRKNYPEKKFPNNFEGLGKDMTVPPMERAEEVLRWIKRRGWDGLEETVLDMSKDW
ncbi:hypothetical protein BDU57DRAFT_439480 [Ampelomyces quisqualis]|uniref:NAD-dependent epimerase/dehydratase domain-containing protein n=1 Tax=Ampelomyces quisqualis TaxID=50730 RepID=A0A6A5QYH2_AMPQU|nr:hypothetical protein BDU57DRAFT_439480 [Ampelomyces quisqualis]